MIFLTASVYSFQDKFWNPYGNMIMKNNLSHCQDKEWPTYRRSDLQKHKTLTNKVWISYKDGVYDITEFLRVHPGGSDKVMMAAGGDISIFWEMYSFHKKDDVIQLLEKYKIGNLHPDDVIKPD